MHKILAFAFHLFVVHSYFSGDVTRFLSSPPFQCVEKAEAECKNLVCLKKLRKISKKAENPHNIRESVLRGYVEGKRFIVMSE